MMKELDERRVVELTLKRSSWGLRTKWSHLLCLSLICTYMILNMAYVAIVLLWCSQKLPVSDSNNLPVPGHSQ
jgi:hypothetical protein